MLARAAARRSSTTTAMTLHRSNDSAPPAQHGATQNAQTTHPRLSARRACAQRAGPTAPVPAPWRLLRAFLTHDDRKKRAQRKMKTGELAGGELAGEQPRQ